MTIPTCPTCRLPAHASESDDDHYHAGCRPLTADPNNPNATTIMDNKKQITKGPVVRIDMRPVWQKGGNPGEWKITLTRYLNGVTTFEHRAVHNWDEADHFIRHTIAVDGYLPIDPNTNT